MSFCRPGVLADPLAHGRLRSLYVEQIVSDLKCKAKTLSIRIDGRHLFGGAPATIAPSRTETRIMAPVLRRWIDSRPTRDERFRVLRASGLN